MADQRLLNYIKQSQAKGLADEQIRQTLLKAYWAAQEIDEAFNIIKESQKKAAVAQLKEEKTSLLKKIGLFPSRAKGFVLRKKKPIYGLDVYMGKKPVFGLDISDYSLEAIQLAGKKGIIKLEGLGRMILKPNIIRDGQILQEEELSRSIISLLTNIKFGKIKTNDVVCSLPESQIFSHVFKFPPHLKKEQIKEALKYEAEGIIPMPIDQVYYDFLSISAEENAGMAKEQEIFFVASQKKIVNSYTQALLNAGLNPVALENESFSLSRSLFRETKIEIPKTAAGVPIPLRGTMILDLGARTTNLAIVDRKGIRMAVNVRIAGDKFTEAVAQALGISLIEADKMKREYGLSKDVRQGKQFIALSALVNDIFEEIKKAISYYEGEKRGKITKILLAGGSAQLPGLIDYFYTNLSGPINTDRGIAERIEIKVGNPWKGIEFQADLAPKYLKENIDSVLDNIRTALARRSILYATAIGIALRAITQDPAKAGINLLPIIK